MDFIASFFADISKFLSDIWVWFDNTIYQFFTDTIAYFVIWSTVAGLKFKLTMINLAWDVAKSILIQLNISSLITTLWSSLDAEYLNLITFFRIPEAINILLSARVTRYVLSFFGF